MQLSRRTQYFTSSCSSEASFGYHFPMDTIICGSSAFRYWRMPPVVHLLVAGPEDDPFVSRMATPDELLALRVELAASLPLSIACAQGNRWRHCGEDARRIRETHPLLAPACDLPLEILVRDKRCCHESGLIRPRVWTASPPPGSLTQIAEDICVTSPAFTMLQLAARFGLVRTVLLASELCGTFATFKAPPPLARFLQKLIDRNRLPEIDGWRPSPNNGRLTDLWMRPSLLDPTDLLRIAAVSESRNGCSALERAARLVVPDAASPFEVQAAVLFGFSRRLGGEGFEGLRHNVRVPLSPEARLLARRDCCYCDLWWEEGVDVECQSSQHHDNLGSYLSDSERTSALKLMGVDVVPITYEQLRNPNSFDALVRLVAEARGTELRKKTAGQLKRSRELRDEVFCDWLALAD